MRFFDLVYEYNLGSKYESPMGSLPEEGLGTGIIEKLLKFV